MLCGTLLFTEQRVTILVFAGQRGKGIYLNIHLHVMEFLQKGQKKWTRPVFLHSVLGAQGWVGDGTWCWFVFEFLWGYLLGFKHVTILPNQV